MPTNRRRRARAKRYELTATAWAWLTDSDMPEGQEQDYLEVLRLGSEGMADAWEAPRGAEIWAQYGAEVVTDWIKKYPGTRPSCWWRFDAPEPRRRLGGIGTPRRERLADAPSLYYGVPSGWIDAACLAIYEEMGRPLDVPAIDPAFPPIFESEATYLDRFRLLQPGERKRLAQDDFAPETVIEILGLDAEGKPAAGP